MIVLALETSSTTGGVALTRDGKLLTESIFEEGLVHGRELAPAVKQVTESAGVTLKHLDLIAVDIGPGSYTGVRVGVTAAKTLAWALGTKLAAVISLDALAEAAGGLGPNIVPVLDARREQLYTAAYRSESGKVTRISCPAVVPLENFLDSLKRPAVLLGDALERLPDKLAPGEGIEHAPKKFWIPRAPIIAELGRRIAERCCHCEEHGDEAISSSPTVEIASLRSQLRLADPVTLEPLYLRRSEAEEKFGVHVDPGELT